MIDTNWALTEMKRMKKKQCNKDNIYYKLRGELINYIDLSTFKKSNWKNEKSVLTSRVGGELYSFETEYLNSVVYRSSKQHVIKLTCKTCGATKEVMRSRFSQGEMSCTKCKPKVSLPEKIVMSLFNKNKINYSTQVKLPFTQRKLFDFMVCQNSKIYLIETHGEQHYKDIKHWSSPKESDRLKKEMCKKYGITLIEVDCRTNYHKSIYKQLKDSEIGCILSENISQEELISIPTAKQYKNMIRDFKKGISVKELEKIYNIENLYIYEILKRYGIYEPKKRGSWRKKKVRCVNTGDIFDSLVSASKFINQKSSSGIWGNIKGRYKSAGVHPETGEHLMWEYI